MKDLPELVPEDEAGMGWSCRTGCGSRTRVDVLGDLNAVSLSARWARAGGKGSGLTSRKLCKTIVQIHKGVTNSLATNSSRVSLKSRMTEGHISSETEAGPRSV